MPKTSFSNMSTESKSGGSKYIRLEEGSNKMRLVGEPYESLRHKKQINGQWKNICCMKTTDENADCPICALGKDDTPRKLWIVKVIDRKDGKIKLFEQGTRVFSQLKALAEDEDWGNPEEYDINIKREGTEFNNTVYTVIGTPKRVPLTEDEKKAVEADEFDLDMYTTPRPKEEIVKILMGEDVGKPKDVKVEEGTDLNVEDIPF